MPKKKKKKSKVRKKRSKFGKKTTKKVKKRSKIKKKSSKKLKKKINQNKQKLKDGLPTIPTTLKEELDMNIFLRSDKKNIQRNINLNNPTALKIFSKLRDLKDNF